MKLIYIISAMFLVGCSAKVANTDARKTNQGVVSYMEEDLAPGLVSVSATGFGKTKPESEADAKTVALKALLFRGIAGSKYASPLISDEKTAQNSQAVKDILNTGVANSFITQATTISSAKISDPKGYETVEKVQINVDALRKYLEQKQVIKSFGF